MATTTIIPIHGNNGASILTSISARNDYYTNPNKTNEKEYVSAYECSVDSVSEEFVISKNMYTNITGRGNTSGKGVLAYQIRQSFAPDETTPEQANEVGYQLALEFTKGQHQFIVATHVDKAHIHNHICFNSTNLDCNGKFNNRKNTYKIIQQLSDKLCKEKELSVIENPNPKGEHYHEWQKRQSGGSWKSQIKTTIDELLTKCDNYNEFLSQLKGLGFEVKQGKHISFKAPNQERFTRGKTLGNAYTETALKERLGKPKHFAVLFEDDISNLINIEKKMEEGKGKGFEQWAKIQNLKTMAKSMNVLAKTSDFSLEEFKSNIDQKVRDISIKSKKIRKIEERQKEINEYQMHIKNYKNTKDTYTEYRKAKDKDSFKHLNHGEIIFHENAKKYFNGLGVTKLPKLSELQNEFRELNTEKKTLYDKYYDLKEEVKQYQTVQRNIDQMLGEKQNKITRSNKTR